MSEHRNLLDYTVKFPHINRLEHVVEGLGRRTDLPRTVHFTGTVKIHGTNLGIRQEGSEDRILSVQSRNRLLSPESENYGTYTYVQKQKHIILELFDRIRSRIDDQTSQIIIFGEWAGEDLHKYGGVNNCERFLALFDISVQDVRCPEVLDDVMNNDLVEARIFNVRTLGIHEITLDRDDPYAGEEEVDRISQKIGDACPMAAFLGSSGTGEGLVWRMKESPEPTYWFKSKSKEFSIAEGVDVKPLSVDSVDVKAAKVYADSFAKAFITPARCEQASMEVCDGSPTRKLVGPFLKWIMDDVLREEGQNLSSFTTGYVCRALKDKARTWYLTQCIFEQRPK